MERLVTNDPIGGRLVTTFEQDGKVYEKHTMDVAPIVERNLALRNENDLREMARKSGFVLFASIPVNVWWEIKRQGIVDDPERYRKWLNDRDQEAFRTLRGKI